MGRDQNQRRREYLDEDDSPWSDYPDDALAFGYGQWASDMFGHYHVSTIEILEERLKFSPDFYKIRQNDEVPLFVYDHMKQGGARHTVLLKGANYYGTAHTVQKGFRMYKPSKRRMELLPFEVPEGKDNMYASVRGELYGVSPEHIIDIDEYMRNTMAYERKYKLVVCEQQAPYQELGWKTRNCAVEKAFMYVARKEYWSAEVAGTLEAQSRITYNGDAVPVVAQNRQFYDATVTNMSRFSMAD